MSTTAVKSAAVRYTNRGWTIIPLFGVDQDGDCGCGNPDCQSPGKHPVGLTWKTISDPEAAAQHYEENPHHNIGIVAGPSRLVIIDLDGPDAIERFMRKVPASAVKGVLAVDTARGVHLYFADDPDHPYGPMVGRDDDAGIDVRAGSSYVVAPPSTHKSGHVYAWRGNAGQYAERGDPLPIPPELHAYLEQRKAGSRVRVLGETQRIGEGQRHTTLVSLAGTMRARGMSEREIVAALVVANEERCDPPMDQRDVQRIAQSVARYEPNQTRDPLALLQVLVGSTRPDAEPAAPAGFVWLDDAAVASLPPTRFLVDELVPERGLTMTYGRRSSGKSFDALDLGLCVATGLAYRGFATVRSPVAYVMAEGQGGAAKRVAAWKHARGVDAVPGFRMLMRGVRLGLEESVAELVASLDAWPAPPALLIIDTLARCLGGLDENKAVDATLLVHHLGEITRLVGCGVHLVHHAGWNDQHERGSSVLGDACDGVVAMRRVDPDDQFSPVRWKPEKTKDGEIPRPQTLRIVPTGESAVLQDAGEAGAIAQASAAEARDQQKVDMVAELLRDGGGRVGMSAVCERLGGAAGPVAAATVREWRKKPSVARMLVDTGIAVVEHGRGRGDWTLIERAPTGDEDEG